MNNYIAYVVSMDFSWFQYVNGHRWYVLDQTMPILTLLGDGITLLFGVVLGRCVIWYDDKKRIGLSR